MNDLVNHPDHYVKGRNYEPIDVLEQYFPRSPLLWQVGKYLSRCGRKADPFTDLSKALWYLDRYIKVARHEPVPQDGPSTSVIAFDWFPQDPYCAEALALRCLLDAQLAYSNHVAMLVNCRIYIKSAIEEACSVHNQPKRYTFDQYYNDAVETVIYDDKYRLMYPALGLAGEAGEVAEKVKKLYRDNGGKLDSDQRTALKKELGDVLWYIAAMCRDLDISMSDVALSCIEKLRSRKERNVLQGNGDER